MIDLSDLYKRTHIIVQDYLLQKCGKDAFDAHAVLNLLGDKHIVASIYGAEISLQRADLLDQICAYWAMHQALINDQPVQALDIGCGIGAQSLRLAALGAAMTANDIVDQDQLELFNGFITHKNIDTMYNPVKFSHGDIRNLLIGLSREPTKFNLVYSQRMWSSLPYADAANILRRLQQQDICTDNSVFFISAIGLDTEIGKLYPHRNRPVEERFSVYDSAMAQKHGVQGPECLYTLEELTKQFEDLGLNIVATWESDFGNPKIIATCRAQMETYATLYDLLKQCRHEAANEKIVA